VVTDQNTGQDDDDWGSPTEWQRPAQGPPVPGPGAPGGTPPAGSQYQSAPQYQPPQYQPPQYQPPPPFRAPQNYLIPAVVATLFCFLPTGIAAIYYASQVTSKMQIGDVAGATQASKRARTWLFVTLGIGVIVWLAIIGSYGSTGTNY
jgi:hypothetical protein